MAMQKLIVNKANVINNVCLFLGFLFLIWRAPFGYSFNDEPFIISLGQRLSYGDALIVDEWHLTQFFGPTTMLFYKLFHLFSQTNEGIVLTFRYFYSFLWFLVSYSVYRMLRYKYRYAIIIFSFLVLFAPFDNMSISYKSVGLMCGLLISCIIYYSTQKSISNLFFSVCISVILFLFSCCIPYISIVYIFLLLSFLLYNMYKKKFLWSSKYIVVSLLLILFFLLLYLHLFVLKYYSITKVFESFHFLFEDPEHSLTFLGRIHYTVDIIEKLVYKCLPYSICFLTAFLSYLFKFFKKKEEYIYIYSSLGYLFAGITYVTGDLYGTFNNEILDINLLGVVAFMLLKKKPWDMFFSFSITGICLIITDCFFSSNTGLHELGVNSLICGVGGIVFIVELFKEYAADSSCGKKMMYLFCCIILMFQLSIQLYTRLFRQYWDVGINEMTSTIEVGANKGLKTTLKRKESYTMYYNNLKHLLNYVQVQKGQKFLSLSSDPVIYLDAEMQFGTFSAWSFGYKKQKIIKRYSDYYTNVPNKIPDIIFAKTNNDVNEAMCFKRYKRYDYNGSILFINN